MILIIYDIQFKKFLLGEVFRSPFLSFSIVSMCIASSRKQRQWFNFFSISLSALVLKKFLYPYYYLNLILFLGKSNPEETLKKKSLFLFSIGNIVNLERRFKIYLEALVNLKKKKKLQYTYLLKYFMRAVGYEKKALLKLKKKHNQIRHSLLQNLLTQVLLPKPIIFIISIHSFDSASY